MFGDEYCGFTTVEAPPATPPLFFCPILVAIYVHRAPHFCRNRSMYAASVQRGAVASTPEYAHVGGGNTGRRGWGAQISGGTDDDSAPGVAEDGDRFVVSCRRSGGFGFPGGSTGRQGGGRGGGEPRPFFVLRFEPIFLRRLRSWPKRCCVIHMWSALPTVLELRIQYSILYYFDFAY